MKAGAKFVEGASLHVRGRESTSCRLDQGGICSEAGKYRLIKGLVRLEVHSKNYEK